MFLESKEVFEDTKGAIRTYASDYCNNDTSRNCESLAGTVPTYPKMQLFNRKSTAGVHSVKILFRQAILPIRCFHFGRPGSLPKHSRNLTHSTNHANRIHTMRTIFFCFEVSNAMEQNNNGRGQTKRTSIIIIAHSPRRKC